MYSASELVTRIKEMISIRGTTQKDLLSSIGANVNLLNQLSDKKGMSSFMLAEIADELKCSTDYLLGREQKTAPTMRESDLRNVLSGLSDSELEELLMFARYLKYKRDHQSDD